MFSLQSRLSHSALHTNTKRMHYRCSKCEATIATRENFLSHLHKHIISRNDQVQNITTNDKNMTAVKLTLDSHEDEDSFSIRVQKKAYSPPSKSGVAKLFMQSANSSTNPCRMRHKCRAGVANLFSPCAKIFRHTSIHLKMRHTNIHSFSLLSNV